MNDTQLLKIPQSGQELDGEPPNQVVLEALVVVHLDELVEVDRVQVKDATQVVSEHEVVSQFHDPLNTGGIVVPEKQ